MLNVPELAEVLGVSRPVAYQLVHQKGFPAIHVSPRRIVIPVQGLHRWLDEQAEKGGEVAL